MHVTPVSELEIPIVASSVSRERPHEPKTPHSSAGNRSPRSLVLGGESHVTLIARAAGSERLRGRWRCPAEHQRGNRM